mgnify:CR=1 FL=1
MDDFTVGEHEPPTQPYGILIVDDEEAILESLEFTLGTDIHKNEGSSLRQLDCY